MSDRPTAGQASLEYVAALALMAAVFVIAAPAVGAPDIAGLVVHKLRLGICLVANDVCSAQAAEDAGLSPCPMKSNINGQEGSLTAFSIEIGGRQTLTVTPQSDGTVEIVRSLGSSIGVAGGAGIGLSAGPVRFEAGASGGAKIRVQNARAWRFPDQATAERFLEHAWRNEFNWPTQWQSMEGGGELAAMVGLEVGGRGSKDSGQLGGFAASGHAVAGARFADGGLITFYERLAIDGPEVATPLGGPSRSRGRDEWLAEYTFGRDGPREFTFRKVEPDGSDKRVVETAYRLDVRDPANYAIARRFIEEKVPWPPKLMREANAVIERVRTHGVIERVVSEVDDDSKGFSGSVRGGWKFGGGGKLIKIHKQLVEATARTGGPYDRERFDCVGQLK